MGPQNMFESALSGSARYSASLLPETCDVCRALVEPAATSMVFWLLTGPGVVGRALHGSTLRSGLSEGKYIAWHVGIANV